MKLNLPNVTIWAACWSGEPWMQERTIRVLNYCSQIIEFERIVFFALKVPVGQQFHTIAIPKLDWIGWNDLVVCEVPKHIHSDYAMCVHEDGFPLDVNLWEPEFLQFDYIGAPWDAMCCGPWPKRSGWPRLLTGNGGFFIQSWRMMELCRRLGPMEKPSIYRVPSDVFVCRTKRKWFEERGAVFAPAEVAARFSTEQTHKDIPSFGFHGRKDSPEKYARGWEMIDHLVCA